MKRVVATAGDSFCWRPEIGTHTVGDQPMPPPSADALRLGLRSWQGCRVLAPGEIIGYGQGPDSYDSRYLGPIREVHLWGVYRPVWIDESAENHLSEIQFDRSLTDNMEWPLRRRSLANGRPPSTIPALLKHPWFEQVVRRRGAQATRRSALSRRPQPAKGYQRACP